MLKKVFSVLVLLITLTVLISCEEKEIDDIKPHLTISADSLTFTVDEGDIDDFNEMIYQGVIAIDNIDGVITSEIQLVLYDFDINVPGEYQIGFYVYDSSKNISEVLYKTIIVRKKVTVLVKYPIYLDEINGEKGKPEKQNCFQGAWYHKVYSSKDKWFGIEGTVILPEVDLRRYNGNHDEKLLIDPNYQNLDNPSIYMGGHATNESDVGLSLSKVLLNNNGTNKISTGSYAFRPFWRYITNIEKDVGGYDLENDRYYSVQCNGNNCIANYHYMFTEYYYLPGDELRIIVHSPEPNKLQLMIEVINESTIPESIKIRKNNNWEKPRDFISPIFHSPGHGTGINTEYKRVNAIDQVANEGKPAINTESEITNAIWKSVYLYRNINGINYRVPLNESRSEVLNCPESEKFTITDIDSVTGGSTVSIHPAYKSNKR